MHLSSPSLINLAHLDGLSTRIDVDGESLLATSIYADAPMYAPVGAPGEGIACVDDVARAAIVYLDEHTRTGDAHALDQGRAALNFTMRMQEPDGRFTNFITDWAGTINRTGETSRAGLGWWAFRGMWALARGYREFARTDAAYAARLLDAYQRTEHALATSIAVDPTTWTRRIPPDQAAVAALALDEMQETRPTDATQRLLGTVVDGLRDAHVARSAGTLVAHSADTVQHPEIWHAWGAHAGEALARAGALLHRPDLIDAAKVDVEGVLAWELAAGRIHGLAPAPVRDGQQAYGISCAVRASMALYRATGDIRYAQMSGAHASWLFGNNMAHQPMYDASTGRVYDGIDGPPRGVNRSSGAESTVEGLMALQAIAATPEALRVASMHPTDVDANAARPSTTLAAADGSTTTFTYDVAAGHLDIASSERGGPHAA